MHQKTETLLTVADIAKRYGKSVNGVYHMTCYRPGSLPPSIKVGRALRWRPEDVEAWEKSQHAADDSEEVEQ
ncbi:helix-turn-helix transcriptional regulator [Bifidobacterium leontopitheci]|uniref:Helix-turn-helix domain-containing protein n=1 Tax=Bifidobacterium leontopitheci TaxID=2650774 RepID=A0A6I1GLU2_9BIFI|nr:helix-turn-helix domain-containing protein [Bifidobacterium leontopitheci]KAB7790566.1 hypothetical protein F7D09_0935 [Bifidobacterium leontopitheci]